MRSYIPGGNIDRFYKKKGKNLSCTADENERESIIPLLNMDSLSKRQNGSGDDEGKIRELGDSKSPVDQGMNPTYLSFLLHGFVYFNKRNMC